MNPAMDSEPLFVRLCDRTTREHACEVAVVAHAMLNPVLLGAQPIRLSAAACALLDVVILSPSAARVALVPWARLHLAWETADVRKAALAMAEEVATLSVQDLAAVGTFAQTLDLLDSSRRDRRLAQKAARAA